MKIPPVFHDIGDTLRDFGEIFTKTQTSVPGSPHKAHWLPAHRVPLKPYFQGFNLGGRCLSKAESYKHCLVYGRSGSGKSSMILINSIFSMSETSSLIIHDPNAHLYNNTAAHLTRQGVTCKLLSFSKVNEGFNPLAYITSRSELNSLAEKIIRTALGSNDKESYWNERAIDLLQILLRVVQYEKKAFQTLPRVYRLLIQLQGEEHSFAQYVEGLRDQELSQEVKAFIAEEPKQKSSVMSTVKAALQRYGSDPTIGLMSSFDSLNLDQLRKKRMAIFVSVPASNHEYYRTPNSIFWQTLFHSLMQKTAEESRVSVFCLMDEAGWLRIPGLPSIIAVARKHFGVLLAVQNAEQLRSLYGEHDAATIEHNCNAKLYLTGQSYKLGKQLEEMLGKREYTSGQVVSLMDHIGIRMMSPSFAILLIGNKAPVKLHLTPYYESKRLRKYTQYSRANVPKMVSQHPAAQSSEQLLNHSNNHHVS